MCALKRLWLQSVSGYKIDFLGALKEAFLFPQQELTCIHIKAGVVEFAHVELDTDDGKHDDGKEEQQSNLKKGNHGLHNGL